LARLASDRIGDLLPVASDKTIDYAMKPIKTDNYKKKPLVRHSEETYIT